MLYPSMSTSHVSFPCPAHVHTVLMGISQAMYNCALMNARTRAAAEVGKEQAIMQST